MAAAAEGSEKGFKNSSAARQLQLLEAEPIAYTSTAFHFSLAAGPPPLVLAGDRCYGKQAGAEPLLTWGHTGHSAC